MHDMRSAVPGMGGCSWRPPQPRSVDSRTEVILIAPAVGSTPSGATATALAVSTDLAPRVLNVWPGLCEALLGGLAADAEGCADGGPGVALLPGAVHGCGEGLFGVAEDRPQRRRSYEDRGRCRSASDGAGD
jgi:hypothetical protein